MALAQRGDIPDAMNVVRIQLSDHNPDWARVFAAEAERICAALGGGALLVEHVGSTAVPGLAAKPIVDILLVVANSADEPAYLPALETAEYVFHLREPQWYEHRLLKGRRTPIHLHVFSAGCPETGRLLQFRDRLRKDSSDRELYERTKRSLAAREWKQAQEYADAKTPVIDAILTRA